MASSSNSAASQTPGVNLSSILRFQENPVSTPARVSGLPFLDERGDPLSNGNTILNSTPETYKSQPRSSTEEVDVLLGPRTEKQWLVGITAACRCKDVDLATVGIDIGNVDKA